ncbi:2-iminobutanoate/2-iminopropanoate deaminase [bioreactor metagenome]|uniref:2-iminobutanoate/2-iminopropanoate deaminase n=1 Tax=bioreactor metagenome TaxID=1076179 RepID=A0A645IQX3_9ZZZZ
MKREQIVTDKCAPCFGPYPQGIKMGNMIFTAQVALDAKGEIVPGGIKEQTRAVMENAKLVLEAAGASFDNLAMVTIHLTDLSLGKEMNEVYAGYFPDGNYPCRCCTQCGALSEGFLVEMAFTAIAD